jgi:hypothetical protein
LASVGVRERDDAFRVTRDFDDPVMVLPVIVIAQIDHELRVGDSIRTIFKQMMRLGFTDSRAVWDAARPVSVREVSVLSPVRVIRRGHETGWEAGVVKVLHFECCVAQQGE